MKTIVNIVTAIALVCTATLQAQVSPIPPVPPLTNSSTSSTSTYSQTTTDDDGNHQNENISVSVSNTDDSYTFKAKFQKSKISEIKEILLKELGNATVKNEQYSWSLDGNRGNIYEVNLKGNKVSIALDKDTADKGTESRINELGQRIRNVISGHDGSIDREAQILVREADQLQRDADLMRREAARMQREADRILKENKHLIDKAQVTADQMASQYSKDAMRMAEEGMRIAEEALRMHKDVNLHGEMGEVVERILNTPETKLPVNFVNANNWMWPKAQGSLLNALLKDDMIASINDVIFIKEQGDVFINGTEASSSNGSNYSAILKKNGIPKDLDFSFYKKNLNIVIVDDRVDVEKLLKAMVNKGFIKSLEDQVLININGATASIDGKMLNANKLANLNALLAEYNVIPAPGKILKIAAPKNYILGYENGRATLGTWILKD